MSNTKTKKTVSSTKLPRAALKLRQADPFYQQEVAKYAQPLPSRSYMLQILTERGTPMFPEELVELFAIQSDESDFFSRRLNAMAREGEVVINRKGAICVAEKLDLIKGRVQGHPDGFGFVVPDDGTPDLFIGPREMHKVLHRDRVMVREIGLDRRGRREGKVVEVLEHVNSRVVGRLHVERGVRFVLAEDKRISQEILVSPEGSLDAATGQIVTVELVSQPSTYSQAIGRIVEVLGNYADPGMEIEIALRKHDLPYVFSAAAETQARKTAQIVQKKDWKTPEGLKREDLRALPLVTIDGETARDFDDAVYAEKDGKGWRLVVAIADVSHYVRPKDALDETGYERGNSVYFPRRVIPMLPEELSNGICSLNPDVERCCMVCDMRINADGAVSQYRFYPAVMLSKARFTYTEVAEILQSPKGAAAKARKGLVKHLQDLYGLFQTMLKARGVRGAIDFETTETQMIFNEAGKIERIEPVQRNDAHRLIEECMLAANVCAADFLTDKHPSLYRVHEGPTERKLENLRRFLGEHGLALGGGDEPRAQDYAILMELVKARPDVGLMQTMLLRSMQQAVYSPERKGHFGLAYDAYTHFTSPIRRYPDLLVHRAIKAVLKGNVYQPGSWEEIGAHCSATERRADEATRDVQNWLKCYFMRDRIGEVFDGVISAVTSFGVFVLLDGLFVEGLVHISELGTDYFHYDEAKHVLRGERSGKVYGLTDPITIKVARVDLETSKIDFVLLEQPADSGTKQLVAAAGKRHSKQQPKPAPAPARMNEVAAAGGVAEVTRPPVKKATSQQPQSAAAPAKLPGKRPAKVAGKVNAPPLETAPKEAGKRVAKSAAKPGKAVGKSAGRELAPEDDKQPDSPRSLVKRPPQVAALFAPKPKSSPLDAVIERAESQRDTQLATPAAPKSAARKLAKDKATASEEGQPVTKSRAKAGAAEKTAGMPAAKSVQKPAAGGKVAKPVAKLLSKPPQSTPKGDATPAKPVAEKKRVKNKQQ